MSRPCSPEPRTTRNMPLGFYYSPPDMHHPGFRDTSKPVKDTWHGDPTRPEWATYLDYMDAQLRELLTEYGPVAVIWFDGLDHQEKYKGEQVVNLVHQIQPATLVNNRLGVPGDFATPEQFIPDRIPTKSAADNLQGTTKTPESTSPSVPAPDDFQLWETCMTINGTWAYNKNDTQYKSAKELIQDLANVASKGGNLLLDVGPTPEGTIQPEFVERLQAMGQMDEGLRGFHLRNHLRPAAKPDVWQNHRQGQALFTSTCSIGPRKANWKCRGSRGASRRSPCWATRGNCDGGRMTRS